MKIKKFVENPGKLDIQYWVVFCKKALNGLILHIIEYTPEKVRLVSGAAAALCVWVHAIYVYASVAKEVKGY